MDDPDGGKDFREKRLQDRLGIRGKAIYRKEYGVGTPDCRRLDLVQDAQNKRG